MKGKRYLWRGRCIYEGEDVFMKGKMYLWREDVFMKGKMYLWSGRCIYEREDVFMKGRCVHEGEDVFMKRKMYLWRKDVFMKGEKNPGILEEIESKMLSKTKEIPGISHLKSGQIRGIFERKSERNVWESVLTKIPGMFEPFVTARFYNSKGNRRCAGCRFVRDAVGAQISIKKSRNFMRNGWGKPPMEIPHTIFAICRFRFYGINTYLFILYYIK